MVLGVIVAGTFAANAGALEVVGVPGGTHLGVYPYLGGSLILPGERVTLVTDEAAPPRGPPGPARAGLPMGDRPAVRGRGGRRERGRGP